MRATARITWPARRLILCVMAREGELGSDLATILRGQNAVVIPIVAGKYSMPGVADKYVCHNYWRGWCELKVAPEELRQDQLDFARLMCERGDRYCCCTFLKPVNGRDRLMPHTRIQLTPYAWLHGNLLYAHVYCQVNQMLRCLQEWYEHIT